MIDYILNYFKSKTPPINRKVYNELDRLTDHELKDIGIHRGLISAISRGIDPVTGKAVR
tara:strand:+ start:640 stop:816 length:177 start_codon:yes stop_codon:yes gene_type:complete